jgi:signal transduction histidine kinase
MAEDLALVASAMQAIAEGSQSESLRAVARLGDALLGGGAVCVVVGSDERGRVTAWGASTQAAGIVNACVGLESGAAAWLLSERGTDTVEDLARTQHAASFGEAALLHGLASCRRYPVGVGARPVGSVLVFRPSSGRHEEASADRMLPVVSAAAAAFARATLDRRVTDLEHRRGEALRIGLRASEEARSQLAADLHDGPVQVITAALMYLDRATRSPEARRLGLIEQARDTIALTVERARRLIFDLDPASLRDSGLAAAVGDLALLIQRECGVVIEVDVCAGRYADEVETIAYRTVSESLANVRKHARACRVDVAISVQGECLVGHVRDDGRGFDPRPSAGSFSPAGHLGFRSMRGRLTAAGGRLTVKSAPGRGTTVQFRLPLGRCEIAA